MNRRVGITVGEPCGIGPELIVRTLQHPLPEEIEYVIYGNRTLLDWTAESLHVPSVFEKEGVHAVPAGPETDRAIFRPEERALRAKAVLEAINRAVDGIAAGDVSALVTAPLDKSVVRILLPDFTGHTGYLAEKAGVPRTIMVMDNAEIRVALLTEHIPLRDAAAAVTRESIEETILIATQTLEERFHIRRPRVAVLSLNPHGGETADRPEEETAIRPAVKNLCDRGVDVSGPFPADSFLSKARGGGWDLILALYHDQGLIAAKYPGIDKVVNITLGLPYLRVSPGHGTAYDLVGKGIADTRSFERALKIAATGRLDVP